MSTFMVTIYYGPVESLGLEAVYRPQHVYGLRDELLKSGFRVILVPINYVNYCVIAICGYKVFGCNIRYLGFNTPIDRNPVCRKAMDAVLEANEKLNRTRLYLWLWNLINDEMFKCSDLFVPETWIGDLLPLEPKISDHDSCIKCCKVSVTTKTEESPQKEESMHNVDPKQVTFFDELNRAYAHKHTDSDEEILQSHGTPLHFL